MLNLTRLHLGIAHESQFQGLGISPALITLMRAVLEEAMTKVPAEQATTVTKAYLAEFILLF